MSRLYYFKYIVLFVFICCFSQVTYAEDWLQVDYNGNAVFLDRDSLTINNESLYYNIRYYDKKQKDEFVVTIQSVNDTAGRVSSCRFSDYKWDKSLAKINVKKKSKSLEHIDSNSFLYNANLVASLLNEINEENKGPDFDLYVKELQKKIKKYWNPPRNKECKRVVLLLKIGRDGKLLSKKVLFSSGFSDVDKAAIDAVLLASPFSPLPKKYLGQSIDIQFVFDYNVH